jgi:hypothetical protein
MAAEIAGDGTPGDPDQQAHTGRQDAHQERDPGALEGAHEQIAAVAVGAEPVCVGEIRRRRDPLPVDRVIGVLLSALLMA